MIYISQPQRIFQIKRASMKKLIIGFLAVMVGPVMAGPFGINMGDPIGEVIGTNDAGIPYARLPEGQVPKGFERVTVYGTPSTGACASKAFQYVYNADSSGYEVRNKADALVKHLTNKYGEPTKKYDYLRAGSIWKEPQEWMRSLQKKERVYAFYWSNLPAEKNDNIININVEPLGASSYSALIKLYYEFANTEKCRSEGANKIESIL